MKVWPRLGLKDMTMHTNFAHTDVLRHFSFRHLLDEVDLVVEEAVDSKLNAVMRIPVGRIGVHVDKMCRAVANLGCIISNPDAMVPLALLSNVHIPAVVHC